jgi:hypothetical protein
MMANVSSTPMIAFQVRLNGKPLCTAGIGDTGVLGAHVSWVRRSKGLVRSMTGRAVRQELILAVGGLTSTLFQRLIDRL